MGLGRRASGWWAVSQAWCSPWSAAPFHICETSCVQDHADYKRCIGDSHRCETWPDGIYRIRRWHERMLLCQVTDRRWLIVPAHCDMYDEDLVLPMSALPPSSTAKVGRHPVTASARTTSMLSLLISKGPVFASRTSLTVSMAWSWQRTRQKYNHEALTLGALLDGGRSLFPT